tara:strand:+ start:155172 stop:156416 length:1245 start_codon:yes stop_codon:yes gene_type:complete
MQEIPKETYERWVEEILPYMDEYSKTKKMPGVSNLDCQLYLENNPEISETLSVDEPCEVSISYLEIYNPDLPVKDAVAVAPGRGEPAVKFQEVAYFLQKEGYNPVYIIDHRGQGESSRLSPLYIGNAIGEQPAHVDRFEHYAEDFSKLIKILNSKYSPENIFLLSNSTGGSILTDFITRKGLKPDNISAYGNVSPFYLPGARTTVESIAMSTVGIFGSDAKFGLIDFVLGDDCNLKTQDTKPMECLFEFENKISDDNFYSIRIASQREDYWENTNSPGQYNVNEWLKVLVPETHVGAMSKGWVLRAMDFLQPLAHTWKSYDIPTLFLVGSEDVVVSPGATKRYFERVEAQNFTKTTAKTYRGRTLNKSDFDLAEIEGASHEILNEGDEIRLDAFERIIEFFEPYRAHSVRDTAE